ncbi:scramblase domain-containing protein [Phthorimaea operculella]|nr:scramblase domain-containing protein [Phthorimaea operculella]
MENPIPVAEITPNYQEFEEVKLEQPRLTPSGRQGVSPYPEKRKLRTEDETLDGITLDEKQPKIPETEKQVEPKSEPAQTLLKDLEQINELTVVRRLGVKDAVTLKGKKNQFYVTGPSNELLYTIVEENNWWVGYLCYGLRPMTLRVLNASNSEVIRIIRPYSFTTRLLPCQLQRMEVFAPPGRFIGTVVQRWTPVKPIYSVRDASGELIFHIKGPRFTISCFQDVRFHIMRLDGTEVACTTKRWEGLLHALFLAPVKDRFGMTFFEQNMKGEEKALVLATALLLDYMYYDI